MLNKCMFIGNLGADPEIKSFQNGGRVANIRLAVTEKWKNKNGDRQERTEWVTVSIFSEGLAGVAERFLRKGSKVYIEGKLQTRKWQDQAGNDRYSTEIMLNGPGAVLTMLDGPSGEKQDGLTHRNQDGFGGSQRPSAGPAYGNDLDDEFDSVPF